MEKRTPHCKLSAVKDLLAQGKARSTSSARQGATALGMSFDEMCEVVTSLTSDDFYKSMTSYADHKVWQDVYRPQTEFEDVYLKFTVIDDVLIISFKEL